MSGVFAFGVRRFERETDTTDTTDAILEKYLENLNFSRGLSENGVRCVRRVRFTSEKGAEGSKLAHRGQSQRPA
jgi:hypothetical protein